MKKEYNNNETKQQSHMLLVKNTRVITEKPYHKILYLYPAFDNTFVFLGMLGLRQDCITHMDRHGTVLFEYVFEKPMDAMGMMTDSEAILIETRGNCITLLDLKTHKFTRVAHHFFNQQSDQANIHCFSETKLVCIEEYGRYNDNRFKLSYYAHPLKPKDKPIVQYEARDNEWTYEYLVRKVNQHSMIGWFKARMDQHWEFKTFDCRDDSDGRLNVYQFPQKVGLVYGKPKIELAVTTFWETLKNQFMFVCISSKSEKQANPKLGNIVQNNYVIDTQTSNIREASFSFGERHDYLIDCYAIGPYCMFRTYDFLDGKTLLSPVYYLSNQTEEIVAEEEWECSYLSKYTFPGYDGCMLVENLYENGDCGWFECHVKKLIGPKELAMHFLLCLNPNFDDDLLQDIIEMMDFEAARPSKINLWEGFQNEQELTLIHEHKQKKQSEI